MEVRKLKYYEWVYDKGFVILVDKKNDKTFKMSISKGDSFSRALISFKDKYRIEQVAKWKDHLKKAKELCQNRINRLKNKNESKNDKQD